MLIQQDARSETAGRQGGRPITLAELRSQLASPSGLSDGHRQRLLELSRRLARVQALVGEHARVGFSEHVPSTCFNSAEAG